jgi:Protein of unknown function (DUF2752)
MAETVMTTPAATSVAMRLRPSAAVGAAGLALSAAIVLRDPHQGGSWGFCPFLLLTGQPCPGCGGLRATHDLLTGHVAEAFSHNVYAVGTAILVGLAFVSWLVASTRGLRPRWFESVPRLSVLWTVGLIAFGVLRWLPPLSDLRP